MVYPEQAGLRCLMLAFLPDEEEYPLFPRQEPGKPVQHRWRLSIGGKVTNHGSLNSWRSVSRSCRLFP